MLDILIESAAVSLEIQNETSNSILTDLCYINDFGKGILHEGAIDIFVTIYTNIGKAIVEIFKSILRAIGNIRRNFNYKFIAAHIKEYKAIPAEALTKYKVDYPTVIFSPNIGKFVDTKYQMFFDVDILLSHMMNSEEHKSVDEFKGEWNTKTFTNSLFDGSPLLQSKVDSDVTFEKAVSIISGSTYDKRTKSIIIEKVQVDKELVEHSLDLMKGVNALEKNLAKERDDIVKSLDKFNGKIKGILGRVKQVGYSGYNIDDKDLTEDGKNNIEQLVMYLKKLISDSSTTLYNLISAELYMVGQQYKASNNLLYILRAEIETKK